MQINQLRQIAAIAKYQSINKAAQMLNISQPALSATLRELEIELGTSLFVRTRKGVIPTAEGLEILQETEHILESVDRIHHISNKVDLRPEIKVDFGSFFEFLIPDVIANYQRKWPNVSLNFGSLNNLANVIDDITKKHYRICLSCFSQEELDYTKTLSSVHVETLLDDVHTGVFMHKMHPFSSKKQIPVDSLLSEQIIMTNSSLSDYYTEIFPVLAHAYRITAPNFFSALHLVQLNSGITLQNISPSKRNIYLQFFPDVVEVPLSNNLDNIFYAVLITPKYHMMSKFELDLVDSIKTVISN